MTMCAKYQARIFQGGFKMMYADKIRTFDMEAAERRAIEEAEARYLAHNTRQKLEQLHDAVLALDALVIGWMMRGMK